MNVCPGPQELYSSKHIDMNPIQRETVSHIIQYLVYLKLSNCKATVYKHIYIYIYIIGVTQLSMLHAQNTTYVYVISNIFQLDLNCHIYTLIECYDNLQNMCLQLSL